LTVRISEAGRVLAKRNTDRMMAVHEAVAAMMAEVGLNCDGSPLGKRKSAPVAEADAGQVQDAVAAVEAMLRKSDSVDGIREQLRAAIKESLADPMSPGRYVYVSIEALFADRCVYRTDGLSDEGCPLFEVAYSLDKTTTPATMRLGAAVEVEVAYVPKAAPAAATDASLGEAFVPLLERAVELHEFSLIGAA
jgi:hypothetical protein